MSPVSRSLLVFFSAVRDRLLFAEDFRFELDAFDREPLPCLLVLVFEELRCPSDSRANALVAAMQIMAESVSANLIILIPSKNRRATAAWL